MADGTWDNGGQGAPAKAGMPLWGKIALGCGIAFLVVLVTCVGGIAYVANRFKKDPEGAKHWAMGFAADKMRPDWEDFSRVVNQLRTPEGALALYGENPDLAKTWPRESDFLQAAATWRKTLPEVPPLGPTLLDGNGIGISHEFNGKVRVTWRPKVGPRVSVAFQSARSRRDTGPRKVAELEIQ